MTKEQLAAWIQTVQTLANAGILIGGLLRHWLPQAHPTLTAPEQDAAYAAIMADDDVRAALARQASRPA